MHYKARQVANWIWNRKFKVNCIQIYIDEMTLQRVWNNFSAPAGLRRFIMTQLPSVAKQLDHLCRGVGVHVAGDN